MAAILVVEDDPALLEVAVMLLRLNDYIVTGAQNGEAALRHMQANTPDLVITDIEMPILDGPGLIRRMPVQNKALTTVPVILLSGLSELREIARKVGTPYYLSKPYDIDALLRLIKKAMSEKTPPNPSQRKVG